MRPAVLSRPDDASSLARHQLPAAGAEQGRRGAECPGVGQALAKMHLAGADFPMSRANALSVSGWRPLFEQAASRADEVQHGLRDFIGAELDHLEGKVWHRN